MTSLADLPPELILSISQLLSNVDFCCFAVCNRGVYHLLQAQTDLSSCLNFTQKFSLITRLERDIPPYFACKPCNLLHRYDGSDRFGVSGLTKASSFRYCPPPSCVQYCSKPLRGFEPWSELAIPACRSRCPPFSFLHVKLAMRRFYHGPECGISIESLSHTQVWEKRAWLSGIQCIWLFSREAQICTEPLGLYLRVQDILLFTEWRGLVDKPYISQFDPLVMCPHDETTRLHVHPYLTLHAAGNLLNSSTKGICYVCNTEFEIERCEIDSQKAVVITRWVNLGPGFDQKCLFWKPHVVSSRLWYIAFDPAYSVQEQSPKQRFEETAPQSFRELRHRNIAYLKDKEYRRIMRYSRNWGVWHSPFREPSTSRIINLGRSLLAFFGMFPGTAP